MTLLFLHWPNPGLADELAQRRQIRTRAKTLLLEEKFDVLGALADVYRRQKSRTPSGIWRLTLFYAGIDDATKDAAEGARHWADLEGKTIRWTQKYPKSPAAHIARGMILVSRATQLRARGPTSGPKGLRFLEQLQVAKSYLMQNKKIASIDPHWYVTMINIIKAQKGDMAEFRHVVNEGLARAPLLYQLHFAAVDYLTPKWYGSKEAIESFAQTAVEATQHTEGMALYARIYWYAARVQYGDRLFKDSAVVWAKMKTGIDDVLAQYPNEWNVNNFARFACLAGDRAKTRALLGRLRAPPIPAAWTSLTQFERCRVWAFGAKRPELRAAATN